MKKLYLLFSIMLLVAVGIGCEPSSVEPVQPGNLAKKAKTGTRLSTSTSTDFRYEDSIVYLRPSPWLSPVAVPGGAHSFSAVPNGLMIDAVTGVIDMSRSETGMWFTITCKAGNTIYQTRLMISGIEYASSTYNLQQNQRFLTPYYNGSLANQMPSGVFLVDDRHVVINRATGVINLTATAANIAIGGYKEVVVTYKLNDRSQGAVNKIRLKIYRSNGISALGAAPEEEEIRDRPPLIIIVGGD